LLSMETVNARSSEARVFAVPFVGFDCGSDLRSLLPVGCGVQWPLRSEKPFVASSFLTARCRWICSIRRDRSWSISIPRKQRTGPRSVILYLARRRCLIVVTRLADGEKSSMSSTYSSRIIGASFGAYCLEFQMASGESVRSVKVELAER